MSGPTETKLIPVKFIVNQAQEKAREVQNTSQITAPDVGRNIMTPATTMPSTTQAQSLAEPTVSTKHEYKEISPQFAVCQVCNKPETDDAHIAIGYDAGPSHPGGMDGMHPALPTEQITRPTVELIDEGYSTDIDELERIDNPITQTQVTVFSPGQSFSPEDTRGAEGRIERPQAAPAIVREGHIEVPDGMTEVVNILGAIDELIDAKAISPEEAESVLGEATKLLRDVTGGES